jgi:hypothetical protein
MSCVGLFCVCVVLCVGSGPATGWSPVQGVLPTVYRIKKLKKRRRSNKKDCRTIDTWGYGIRVACTEMCDLRLLHVLPGSCLVSCGSWTLRWNFTCCRPYSSHRK